MADAPNSTPKSDVKGAKGLFSKQIGPLPVGVWVILVVGGLAMAYYFARNQKAGDTTVSESSPQEGVGGLDTSVISGPPPKATYTTNDEWASAAINWAIANNFDPQLSVDAVTRRLEGQQLSTAENAIIRAIFKNVGPPPLLPPAPENPPSSPPPPTPPPPGAPPPPHVTPRPGGVITIPRPRPAPHTPPKPRPKPRPKSITVTVGRWPAWNSTLWGLSQHYYGNGKYWRRIYDANRNKIKNPNVLHVGWRLVIPSPTRNV